MSSALFVGYGSLLSARGLGPQLDALADAELAWLDAPRRFGKPPQKGGRLAMEVVANQALLHGRTGQPPRLGQGGCGALVLHVEPERQATLVRREGYPPRCWTALSAAAGSASVADFLAELAEESASAIEFRSALWKLTGPPKSGVVHYLPHPVRLDEGRHALVFVAPDPGETGDPALPSCKEQHPGLRGVALGELYEHGPEVISDWGPELQTHYVQLCLLGLAHGVFLGDLFADQDLAPDHPARELLRRLWRDSDSLQAERLTLRESLRLGTYPQRFAADLDQAKSWSGLEPYL